jgi:prevent-host-death family protein
MIRLRSMKERTVSASIFKAKCLALLDQVAETRASFVITKRGRPVARVVPTDDPADRRSLKGSVTILTDREEDLFSTGEAWEINDPNLP